MDTERPPRNIILLSDGTGNSAAKLFRTNPWRLYDSLDLRDNQIVCYDDGVGTSSIGVLAVLGGVFGFGLKRNVLDLYRFLCTNYRDGDRIFVFGFSRGAFTVRVLVGLISDQGIIRERSGADLIRLARWAYRRYRRRYNTTGGLVTPLRVLRDAVLRLRDRLLGFSPYKKEKNTNAPVEFVGVWDTVDAYGLPVQELTEGWDQWVWPLSMRDRLLSPIVRKACHALAIDDERHTFHPLLWDESKETTHATTHVDQERISQIWFTGVHSDVGGGYPNDGLAYVSLTWMANEACKRGLRLKPGVYNDWALRADPRGVLHDSRSGLGGYYRYYPRGIAKICEGPEARVGLPKIHESVFRRIVDGTDNYAPITLPENYAIVRDDGTIYPDDANPFEDAGQRSRRQQAQEAAWDRVWWRRVAYFATIAASLLIVVAPFLKQGQVILTWDVPWLSAPVGMAFGMLPDIPPLPTLAAYYQQHPLQFGALVAVVFALMTVGKNLAQSIADSMRKCWLEILGSRGTPELTTPYQSVVYSLRSSPAYTGILTLLTRRVMPTIFGIAALFWLLATANRVVFELATTAGAVCRPSADPSSTFPSNSFCHDTGVDLEKGKAYTISITPSADRVLWSDGDIAVGSTAGFTSGVRPHVFFPALALRRRLFSDWFVPVARVGRYGFEYYSLAAPSTTIEPRHDGRLFLFVNDVVVPWPWWDAAYANNRGTVAVRVQAVPVSEKP